MWTMLLAILLLPQAAATVRFEKEGVRAGDKLVIGTDEEVVDLAKVPVMVSGRSVRNASTKGDSIEAVMEGGQKVVLGPGVKLQREEKRFKLMADRGKLEVSAGDKKLQSRTGEMVFEITAKGFDFGKAGLLEGAALAVSTTAGKK